MKALILAAGLGSRLKPLTSNTPKPLLFVAGKPFLSHTLAALRDNGITEICILTGWKAMKIRDYYGDGSQLNLNLTYIEQKELQGTASAVLCAENHLQEPFVCLNGDVLTTSEDLAQLLTAYEQTKSEVMGIVKVANPSAFGSVAQEDNVLIDIKEKSSAPLSDYINAGLFVFTPEIFRFLRTTAPSARGEYEITDTLRAMTKEKTVYTQPLSDRWLDIGMPQDLLAANTLLMSTLNSNIAGEVENGAVLKGPVVVEEGALVRAGAYIEGPVYISTGCDVGPNCYLRPYTALAPHVRIGAAVEVKNSIIMAHTHIPHHNYVGDSIIGENCNLGAGTKIANLRFDGKNVKLPFADGLVDSQRRKMGAIIGDSVSTGINAMINAGSIIFENTTIGPGALVSGRIAPGSRLS
ncbi:bifunctional sugar-1-phosphate nucleotidylyltransferase/acetyltransferase [Candidatus Methanomassiliicoccus intestinalis]|uniref:bifunctional sugar-1-phosphate nucleotidylyltransferase/acetyltransferase n=1 Tax=Candidatus Methanomassiliicoccus intestinalis TaxID=1406512 RepID=UPI0037DC167D